MNYSAKKNQIDELTHENQVFQQIVSDNKRAFYWNDIIDVIEYIKAHSQFYGDFSKNFYSVKNFKPLEVIGIDYNYLDAGGNNFLQYAINQRSTISSRNAYFNEDTIEYIVSKTDNIYNINNYGEHLLFDMMQLSNSGHQGEDFFKMLNKYPDFDLHTFNKDGKNLLNYALIGTVPKAILNFLLEQKLSINHIDKDGHNLLHSFPFMSFTEFNKQLFAKILLKNDICQLNKWKANCVIIWGKIIKQDNDENATNWLLYTVELLKKGQYYKSDIDNKKNLYNLFKNHPTNLAPVKKFVTELYCKILDEELNDKTDNLKNIKKVKI